MRTRNWIAVFFWSLLCCVFFCAGNVDAGFVRVRNSSTNTIKFTWKDVSTNLIGTSLDDVNGIVNNNWNNKSLYIYPGESFESYCPDNLQYQIFMLPTGVQLNYEGYQNYEFNYLSMSTKSMISVAPSLEYLQLLLNPPTWDKTEMFFAGFSFGLTLAGGALVVRLIRQVGRVNPQI